MLCSVTVSAAGSSFVTKSTSSNVANQSASKESNRIHFLNAVFGYENTIVVDAFDFIVARSEVIAFVGASGCGKTTMLKAISGAIPLLSGTILLDGQPRDRQWLSRNLSRTLQNSPLFHWLTVQENLELACKIRGMREIDARAVLAEFAADHVCDRYPQSLSGGERCRASIAQAAITNPKVILLDEPFSGLDVHIKAEVANYLFSFAQSHGTSMIFVTHDLHDACEYSQRVVLLKQGPPTTVSEILNSKHRNTLERIRGELLRYGRDS